MSGNALNIETNRIDKNVYQDLEKEVINKLYNFFPKVENIQYYHNKESFGDMDLLIPKRGIKSEDIRTFIYDEFNANEIFKNDCSYTFDHKNFQIDIRFVPEDDLEVAKFYFSYNDLNLLVGIIANKLDLKFGFDGLKFFYRSYYNKKIPIFLSKNPRKIYEFLDYDYDRYISGFNNLEEIYNFVVTSNYFDYRYYDLNNLNNKNRTRNAKRDNFNGFVNFLLDNNIKQERKFNKPTLEQIDNYFLESNVKEKYEKLKYNDFLEEEISKKFNGYLLMNWLEIEGKELGNFIGKFKNSFDSKEELFNFVKQRSLEEVKSHVIKFYNN